MLPEALQVTGLDKETRVDAGTSDGVGWGEAENQKGHWGYLCHSYILKKKKKICKGGHDSMARLCLVNGFLLLIPDSIEEGLAPQGKSIFAISESSDQWVLWGKREGIGFRRGGLGGSDLAEGLGGVSLLGLGGDLHLPPCPHSLLPSKNQLQISACWEQMALADE